jgi:hypothetical protein
MKPTKDLFVECNEGGQLTQSQFEETFCKVCKNRTCVRAGWAFSKWDKRILTQEDRLLKNPNIVLQSESSRWDGLANLEVFQEPQTIEVWGGASNATLIQIDTPPSAPLVIIGESTPKVKVPEVVTPTPDTERVELPTTQPPPIPPPEVEPDPIIISRSSALNTPAQEITLGEAPRSSSNAPPKNFSSDPWAVTETLPVGGKFKMGR